MKKILFISNFIDKCNCYAYAIDAAVTLHNKRKRAEERINRERAIFIVESIERGSHGLHASWCILKA